MANPLKKLGAALIKTSGQRATEKATKATQAKVREKQATLRAMKGGHVSGLSGSAASGMASDPSLFNGGVKKKGGGYR